MLQFRFPKNDENFAWTNHIKNKMLFYGLSEQRIRRVFKSPKRKEEGIAPETIAAMQASATKKNKEEIWIMYRRTPSNKQPTANNKNKKWGMPKKEIFGGKPVIANDSRVLMISAWRYPGETKPGNTIPIPGDILEELQNIL